ncbi:hypothetical protein [Nonomuraea sp. NPDC002799]
MSTNDERDWFAPSNDRRPEDEPPPGSEPPPGREPPPGLGLPPLAEPPPAHNLPPGVEPMSGTEPPPGLALPPGQGRPRRPGGRRGREVPPPPGYDAPQGPPRPQGARGQGMPFGRGGPQGQNWPTSRGRRQAHADQQVWPPASREPVSSATQPIPAVRTPLPLPQNAFAAQGQQPPPHAPPPQQPSQPAPGPATATRPPRRRRTLLIAAAAVVVAVLTTAAQTYDGYLFYDQTKNRVETREVIVAAGQAGKVYNIEWKAALSAMDAPKDTKHGPEVTWLKVDVLEKVLDAGNATMTAQPTEMKLWDRAGRSWVVEIQPPEDRPTDRLEVGKEYRIQGVAIVPAPVAKEVELTFRPSTYRSDTPTEDFFDREAMSKEPATDVLRFRRG